MAKTPVLLITYDISDDTNRSLVVKKIEKLSGVMLSESSYAIKTDKTPTVIFNQFINFIGKNDKFYVINLRKPYAGRGPKSVIEWLNNNLP